MALSDKHPSYDYNQPDWVLMRDCYEGERRIKDQGTIYLPATSSMIAAGMAQGNPGKDRYDAYKLRAVYHEIVGPAVTAMLGMMHRKPAKFSVPEKLQPLLDRAMYSGESAQQLLYKINEQQLLAGRIGVMSDIADNSVLGKDLPYFLLYNTENIFNWDTSRPAKNEQPRLQFVVLNEAGQVRGSSASPQPDVERTQGLSWQNVTTYRVLARAQDVQDVWDVGDKSGYVAGSVTGSEWILGEEFVSPNYGGRTLDDIPFVMIGCRDLVPEPDRPPLLGMARISLAIYRTEADRREAAFKYGQSTLVLIGAQAQAGQDSDTVYLGTGNVIQLPVGGSANFVQAGHEGLAPLADIIMSDEKRAAQQGANLLDQQGNVQESGQALNTRSAARTVSLTGIANVAAEGLTRILQTTARWMGISETEIKDIKVTPNLDFGEVSAVAADLVSLTAAKNAGAPYSNESMHEWMRRMGFTTMTYEEEMAAKDDDPPPLGTPGKAGGPGALLANQQSQQRGAPAQKSGEQPPKAGTK